VAESIDRTSVSFESIALFVAHGAMRNIFPRGAHQAPNILLVVPCSLVTLERSRRVNSELNDLPNGHTFTFRPIDTVADRCIMMPRDAARPVRPTFGPGLLQLRLTHPLLINKAKPTVVNVCLLDQTLRGAAV
jgi:hypothetical protein